MPHVQITWVEGRTREQKRKIAERVTSVLIEDGKAKRENIHVSFHDVPGHELRRGRRTGCGPEAHSLSGGNPSKTKKGGPALCPIRANSHPCEA
jgi:4-oxalocrotonate tautomerase